jgi:thiol-disulfide isomerase/thioredoxin
MKRLLTALLVALVTAGSLTACGGETKAGTCLSSLRAMAASDPAKGSQAVPTTSVGCLDGSGDVALPALRVPMIVSFWAEYCMPCRDELPALQRFATASAGKVAVIGVDTADVKSMGRSMASGLGLTFPMLFDPSSTIYKQIGARGLPTLLFVRPGGEIAYSLSSGDVDDAMITKLASTYLGVSVA